MVAGIAMVHAQKCAYNVKIIIIIINNNNKAFALIDDDIRMSFCRCIGVDTSDTVWQQTQLSPSRGGLGFRSLSPH